MKVDFGPISNRDITMKAATVAAFFFCEPDWTFFEPGC